MALHSMAQPFQKSSTDLHRVNEVPFSLMKHHNASHQQYRCKHHTIPQTHPAEMSGTQKGIFECLHERGDGIGHDEHFYFSLGDGAEGINNRGGIHEQLYSKLQQECEVAVLGGHTGENETGTQSKHSHENYQQRQQENVHVGLYGGIALNDVIGIYCQEKDKLYAEFYEPRCYFRQGHDKPRKIDLSEYVGIVLECFGGGVETFGKVVPENDAREVKQSSRNAIGTDFGDISKYQNIDGGCHDGLHHKPDGPQHGLFVYGNDIPLYKHIEQVAVLP